MVHLGDITAINGGQIAPTNCIIFGSPCQNLSTAGNRQGLAGAESGLFMEAVRVIKEMREATNGKYPTFAVWENVPGAFSSNKGEDFRVVLEELARIRQAGVSIPEPKRNKNGSLVWAKSGIIGGNGWSIAWRTLDAQYWGVPQRRRRIAVVVDFGGQRAGEILFERKGVSGDSEPSIPPWKGIARNPADCITGYDRMVEGEKDCLTAWDVQSRRIYDENGKWPAIYAGEGGGHGYVVQHKELKYPIAIDHVITTGGNCTAQGSCVYDSGVMATLKSQGVHAVCYGIPSTKINCTNNDSLRTCLYDEVNVTSPTNRSKPKINGPSHTLSATTCGRTILCLQGNIIDCTEQSGADGLGVQEDVSYTLNTVDRHAICCLLNDQGGQNIFCERGVVSPTLRAESHNHEPVICAAFTAGQGAKAGGIGYAEEVSPTLRNEGGLSAMPTVVCRAHGQANAETLEECCPTLNCNHETPIVFESHHKDARYTQQKETSPTCAAYWGTGGGNMPMVAKRQPLRWIVRRLTPTECERLQGFPDDWTAIDSFTDKYGVEHKTSGWLDNKGKWHKAADSPRYKALGNSIALPQWWWITCKMAKYLPEHATMGSLFDGIGGFPLVWETRHGKGTALWASEIEAFPIAVTEKHFS